MNGWAILGQALAGWLAADFFTGVFHWWEDRFGREEWPVIGRWIIAPNRLHHARPLAFSAGGFIGRNGASIVAALVLGAAWATIAAPTVFMAATLIGGAISNEVHFWAHRPAAAGGVRRVLQQIGLIQSPKAHALHHRPPHTVHFCVLTDWLNPVLEAIEFWSWVERLVGRAA
jgi:hypothetical protein